MFFFECYYRRITFEEKSSGRDFYLAINDIGNYFVSFDGVSIPLQVKAQSQGGNAFGIANNIIGGAGVVNGLVGFDAAINSKHVYRYTQRINGRVVSAAELTATNQAKALKVLNASKSIGNKLGVAGGLVIAGDVLYNSESKLRME